MAQRSVGAFDFYKIVYRARQEDLTQEMERSRIGKAKLAAIHVGEGGEREIPYVVLLEDD